jgi:hypothetical protein
MQSVAFKEWALVCAALGEGRQSLILRKGGIAEGREGFAFRHPEFFLFPTYFHEQLGKTRLVDPILSAPADEIVINLFAKTEATVTITSWETVQPLAPLHILREEVVRERFEYGGTKGIDVAFVRVFRLNEPWKFPDAKSYRGCRSWVDLPPVPAELSFTPVVSDDEHARCRESFTPIVRP